MILPMVFNQLLNSFADDPSLFSDYFLLFIMQLQQQKN